MIHCFFNNVNGDKEPEIFRVNLLVYLLKSNIIKNIEEYMEAIKDVDLKDSGFTLIIKEVTHEFKSIPIQGGIGVSHPDYQTQVAILPEHILQTLGIL